MEQKILPEIINQFSLKNHYFRFSNQCLSIFQDSPNSYNTSALKLIKVSDTINSILGLIALCISLFPYRFWGKFVFANQIEPIVIITFLSVFISFFLLFKFLKSSSGIAVRISNIDILVFIYVFYCSCRCLMQYKSLNPEYIYEDISLVVLYLLFRNITHKSLVYCVLVVPLAGITQIFYGIESQTGYFAPGYGLSDIKGTFFNTGLWGGFISVILVVSLSLLFLSLKFSRTVFLVKFLPYLKVLLLVLLCFFIIQLFASKSRAAWCGNLAGVVYLVSSSGTFRNKLLNLPLFGRLVISVLVFLITALFLYGIYEYKSDSANGRLLIWRISGDMIMDKPLFGHGIGGFQANFMEFQANYLRTKPGSHLCYLADDNHYAFNEFVRIGVEQGLVGLVIVVLLLYFLFRRTNPSNEGSSIWFSTLAHASLLSLFVFGLFSYPMELIQFNILVGLFIAIVSKNSKCYDISRFPFYSTSSIDYQKFLKIFKLLFITIWMSLTSFLFFSVYNYSYECKKWNHALRNINKKNDTESLEMLKICYAQLKNNGIFLTTYGKALEMKGQYKDAIRVINEANCSLSSASNYIELGKSYRALDDFTHAKIAWLNASLMVPSLFKPEYLISKMLFDINDNVEACQLANKLLHKKIKIWTPELQMMLDELQNRVKTSRISNISH